MRIVTVDSQVISKPTELRGHHTADFYQVAAFDADVVVSAAPSGTDRFMELGTVEAGKWKVFEVFTDKVQLTPKGETEISFAGASRAC